MNKILLVIKREYLTRVRKRSFIIMTILGPILLASLMIIPFWLTMVSQEAKIIDVRDESNLFTDKIKNYKNLTFNLITASIEDAKVNYLQSDHYGLLYIPALDIDDPKGIEFYTRQNPGIEVQSYIQRILKEEIESRKLQKAGIDRETLENIKTKITINTIKLSEEGEKDSSAVASTIVGYFASFMIYFFIFLYGVQIMRGVIEEKTSRIVEIIISSVKPFQLMMGKITGIALVGLTQLLLWVILTFGITSVIFSFQQTDNFKDEQIQTAINEPEKTGQSSKMFEIIKAIQSINI
ncbi:MAG: ABC transporter permease, partial [Cytophagales bacterium]|nr:ABC transporter permease [Cytophagales bacterium]